MSENEEPEKINKRRRKFLTTTAVGATAAIGVGKVPLGAAAASANAAAGAAGDVSTTLAANWWDAHLARVAYNANIDVRFQEQQPELKPFLELLHDDLSNVMEEEGFSHLLLEKSVTSSGDAGRLLKFVKRASENNFSAMPERSLQGGYSGQMDKLLRVVEYVREIRAWQRNPKVFEAFEKVAASIEAQYLDFEQLRKAQETPIDDNVLDEICKSLQAWAQHAEDMSNPTTLNQAANNAEAWVKSQLPKLQTDADDTAKILLASCDLSHNEGEQLDSIWSPTFSGLFPAFPTRYAPTMEAMTLQADYNLSLGYMCDKTGAIVPETSKEITFEMPERQDELSALRIDALSIINERWLKAHPIKSDDLAAAIREAGGMKEDATIPPKLIEMFKGFSASDAALGAEPIHPLLENGKMGSGDSLLENLWAHPKLFQLTKNVASAVEQGVDAIEQLPTYTLSIDINGMSGAERALTLLRTEKMGDGVAPVLNDKETAPTLHLTVVDPEVVARLGKTANAELAPEDTAVMARTAEPEQNPSDGRGKSYE